MIESYWDKKNADETRHGLSIMVGLVAIIGVGLGRLIYRYPKASVAFVVALYMGDLVQRKVFSSETRDMSKEVSEVYKQVTLQKVDMEIPGADATGYSDWYKDWHVTNVTMTARNDSQARVTSLKMHCTGRTVLQPPDQSYAPETKTFDVTKTIVLTDIPPKSSRTIVFNGKLAGFSDENQTVSGWDGNEGFQTQPGNAKCEVVGADIVEADLYQAVGEVDRYGTALVKASLVSEALMKPIEYMGTQYAISTNGSIKNVSKTTVNNLEIGCTFFFNSGTSYAHQTFENLSLAPGAELKVAARIPAANYRNPDGSMASCRVTKVW